ncbi:MAG: CvpA family protein [Ectothiorhodospiraceae bacterium]|nr:CvpA family protein [Ectothiorhodospiraceae bacterium]
MNWLDYAILAIVALSALISLVRGFVREVLSLLVWVLAFWVGIRFAQPLSEYLVDYIASPTLRLGAAFAGLFIATLLLGAIINYAAGQLVSRTGLTGTDRFIGVLFGVARGVIVVAVLMLAAGLTALPREPWWQESLLAAQIQPWVCRIGVDEWLAEMTVYAPLVDESEEVDGTPARDYWREFCNGTEPVAES